MYMYMYVIYPSNYQFQTAQLTENVIPSKEDFCNGKSMHLGSFRGEDASIAASKLSMVRHTS